MNRTLLIIIGIIFIIAVSFWGTYNGLVNKQENVWKTLDNKENKLLGKQSVWDTMDSSNSSSEFSFKRIGNKIQFLLRILLHL